MVRVAKIDSRAYYNALPPLAHECGDIWLNLPSFGMLGDAPCVGLVITPACDLTWQKSDTLTYLPIVPVRAFFSMDAALPVVLDRLNASIHSSGYDSSYEWSAQSYVPPSNEDLISLRIDVERYRSLKRHSAKVIAAIDRTLAGIEILNSITASGISSVKSEHLNLLFGSEWGKTKERIIQNSYSAALHFVPHDGQNGVFSCIRSHSVVLFRCPITVPVKVLNYAAETSDSAWSDRVSGLSLPKSIKDAFFPARPIKMLSLKAAFLSDLLTRFSALYNRVGSPDFSKETVSLYSGELDS